MHPLFCSLLTPCADADELHYWVKLHCNIDVPRVAVVPGHSAPFDYLVHAYFEPASDVVVWAPRGGGKTRLAAIATLLDLLHKPGCSVRILGGSLEQSMKMWEHLRPELTRVVKGFLDTDSRSAKRINLPTGSSAAVLTQSERAVRGLRVQKLRCDEVELFKPHIWEAAQLVTKSTKAVEEMRKEECGVRNENAEGAVGGVVEAISTLHAPYGLMNRIVEQATERKTKIVKWSLFEVLERCPAERECASCPLWDECQGVAKTRCQGYFPIDDAIAMKRRVGKQVWEAEMLCRKPNVSDCVFAGFSEERHVGEDVEAVGPMTLAIDFGFVNPFVCLWVADDGVNVHVVDEYVQSQRTTLEHIEVIQNRRWGKVRRVACDPAGRSRSDQTSVSNIRLFRNAGFAVHSKASGIVDGLEKIRTALEPALGEPTLRIHKRCKLLIMAMRRYHYGEGGGELPLKDGENDHHIDALRYFYINRQGVKGGSRHY